MTVTEKLKLELYLREQLDQHGNNFYQELYRVLEKIMDNEIDMRGKPYLVNLSK